MQIPDLDGMTVVITGASSGIGQATAEAFARRRARLVLAARGAEALGTVAARCRRLGAETIAVPTDVTDADAVHELARRAAAFGGTVDVWVSNVGVGAVGRFHETPAAAHEQVVRANLVGHMNDAHAAIPIFLGQGYGTFVNVISLGGFAAAPFAAAYSASKFGLRGLSEALRAELADQPAIHVCDVYPSFIDTPGISHAANYVGRALGAPPPVYDARRVARTILGLVECPRPTATVGGVAHLARLAHFLAPGLTGRITARLMEGYFRRARTRPVTDGNLFAPSAGGARIDGGLRRFQRRSAAVLAIAGCVLAGAAAWRLMTPARPRRPPR